jgi:hypothetical protein
MDKGVGKNQKVSSGTFKTEIRVQTHRQNPGRIVLHGNQNGDQNR